MTRKRYYRRGPQPKPRNEHDYGTPELIRHRAMVSQGDPTLSTCPLDAMLSRQIISPEAHAAAVHFRSCRQIMFGSPHPQAVDLNQASGASSIYRDDEAEGQYRDACAALTSRSRRLLDIIENIVVHERWPKWLTQSKGWGDQSDLRRTGEAFATLLGWYAGRQRRAA